MAQALRRTDRYNLPDCPPAGGLPEDMRRWLEELAARRDAAVASPSASQPDPAE